MNVTLKQSKIVHIILHVCAHYLVKWRNNTDCYECNRFSSNTL